MSTIEKAAARLVRKPVNRQKSAEPKLDQAEQPADEQVEQIVVADAAEAQSQQLKANAHLVERRATPRTSQDDVEYASSCELDFPWLAENGFLVPGHKNAEQSHEFRRIKRPLLLNLQPGVQENLDKPTNVIFVTSALPAEGKTYVSINLALSLAAELDRSVLLMDGDVAKRDLSRWMGIIDEPGLTDVLMNGDANGEKAIIDTNVDRLTVMSSGKRQENLDELFASNVMSTMLANLASQDPNRIIVVDGPPLIATTEAAVLAGLMGQTVVVVEAEKTPQRALEQAVERLQGCQLVSMVLNKVASSAGSGYGYGYGYGYGSDADRAVPEPGRKAS